MEKETITLITLGCTVIIIILSIEITVFILDKKISKTSKSLKVIENISEEGLEIPLIASFTGIGSGNIAISHNSFNPLLKLFKDHMEYRVIIKNTKNYSEIKEIDIFESKLTENIKINFKSNLPFTANLGNRKNLKELVGFFNKKGIRLSNKAKDLLKE